MWSEWTQWALARPTLDDAKRGLPGGFFGRTDGRIIERSGTPSRMRPVNVPA